MIRSSDTTTEIYQALIAAAPEMSAVPKTRTAKGERITYTYATLDGVLDMIRSVLPRHGLWVVQAPTSIEGGTELYTRLIHASGEWIEHSILMDSVELRGGSSAAQRVGAAITYYRRYALCAMLGICADDDTDAQPQPQQPQQPQRPQRPQRPQPQQPQPQQPQPQQPQPQQPQPQQPQPQQPQPQQPQRADPMPYLQAVVAMREAEGETIASIYADFCSIIGGGEVRDLAHMTDAERRAIASEMYRRPGYASLLTRGVPDA